MRDYSDPIHQEIRNLLQEYTDMDPYGIWNDAKWEAYAIEHASAELRKYMHEKGKYWFSGGVRGELDD